MADKLKTVETVMNWRFRITGPPG